MDVRLPDGTIVKNVPEGITQSELMARVGRMSAPSAPAKPAPAPEITDAEMIAGNPLMRLAIGAASPILGAAQFGAELVGDKSGSDTLKQLEQMKKRGMSPAADLKRLEQSRATLAKLPGYETTIADIDKQIAAIRAGGTSDKPEDAGFDFAGLLGTVASPVSLAATGMKVAPTALGRMKQGGIISGAFGAATPVTEGDDFWASKGKQIGAASTVGAVLPAGAELVRAFAPGGIVQRTFYPSKGDIANRAAGSEREAVIAALESQRSGVPGVNLTAGQASVPANSPQFAALQKVAEKQMPEVFGDLGIQGQQQAARRAYIQTLSKSDIPNSLDDAQRALNQITGPMRDDALSNANLGGIKGAELARRISERQASKAAALQDAGRFATIAAQQENLAAGGVIQPVLGGSGKTSPSAYPVVGQPRVPPRYTENIQRVPEALDATKDAAAIAAQRRAEEAFARLQAESLEKAGHFPLKAPDVTNKIDAIIRRPGDRASDAVVETLKPLRDKILSLTDERGVIDSRDLYTIRKEIGLSIGNLAKQNGWDKRRVAGLEVDVKRIIDDVIEKAGAGDLWKKYLTTHSAGMKNINDMVIARELENAMTTGLGRESAAGFSTAMKNATKAEGVTRGGGAARFGDIREAMTPKGYEVAEALLENYRRNDLFEKIAAKGADSLSARLEPFKAPSPGIFNMAAGFARSVVNRLAQGNTDKAVEALIPLMRDPRAVAAVMREASPEQRKVISALIERASRMSNIGLTTSAAQQQ